MNEIKMKNLFVPVTIICLFTISCGTGKKLEQANQQNILLTSELAKQKETNAQLNALITGLTGQSNEWKIQNDKCVSELRAANESNLTTTRRFNELSNCLDEQADTLKQIKIKAFKELSAYDGSQVRVAYRNGMVYISMQDQFMFPSGSTKLNPGGKKALSVVADILSAYHHYTAIVVGNTDTMDIKKGFRDNWSLSTERANTIVRYLMSSYGSDPNRLIAAGRSKFSPCASNSTADGRAKNRRTDIIINPDLNKLWLLSQKYP
jgi:chemotaxis protein MotB